MKAEPVGILVLCIFGFGGAQIDPCSPDEHSVIPNMGLRYVNYRVTDDTATSGDSRLTAGWYRVGDDTMPELAPDGIYTCGTKFPVWLNDKHPTGNNIVDRTACQLSVIETCASSYAIKIKKCDTFYVYHLPPTASSNSGYCFGEGVAGTPTTFRASKPVVVHYKKVTFHGPDNLPVSVVHFRCNFSPSQTEELHYMVSWYGEGAQLYNAPLSKQADADVLQLDEQTFVDSGFKMGQHISCSVIAFTKKQGPPGPISEMAADVFVGIKVLTPSLTFVNGEPDKSKRTIRVQPTVHIGCQGTENCGVQLTTFAPANDSERICEQKIALEASVCGIEMRSETYDSVLELVVKKIDDKEYQTEDGQYDIFLETENTQENVIWRNYKLPPIKVNVKPPTATVYKGRKCYSHNDPHIKTFDGRSYDNHQSGVYTMYKHLVYDAEIQVKYSQCGNRNGVPILCNCGFAARAGVTLYIIDVCDEKFAFNYKYCGDEALTVTTKGETEFTFNFIYGTYAVVSIYKRINSYVLTVDIYPSSNDIDNTRGLCGIMDSNCYNDFHYREGEGPEDDPDLLNGPCNRFTEYI